MWLSLSILMEVMRVEPPTGGLSALAWVIIVVLAGVFAAVVPAIWHRGNKLQDKMYEDLKVCNDKRAKTEEDVLGLMKVLRVQMEQSRGGQKR